MRVVEPGFEIIEDELSQLSIHERIERCGRICYKSEGLITPLSAEPFCKKMVTSGHGAVLEMATIHLVVDDYSLPESMFIDITPVQGTDCRSIVSGSVRAFMESPHEYGSRI